MAKNPAAIAEICKPLEHLLQMTEMWDKGKIGESNITK